MCNHAVSLANEGFDVDLVGFAGSGTELNVLLVAIIFCLPHLAVVVNLME